MFGIASDLLPKRYSFAHLQLVIVVTDDPRRRVPVDARTPTSLIALRAMTNVLASFFELPMRSGLSLMKRTKALPALVFRVPFNTCTAMTA